MNNKISMPPGASSAVSRKLRTTVSGGNRVSPNPMVSKTMSDSSLLKAFRTDSVPVTEERESPLAKALEPTSKLARWLFPAPVLPNTISVHCVLFGTRSPDVRLLGEDPPVAASLSPASPDPPPPPPPPPASGASDRCVLGGGDELAYDRCGDGEVGLRAPSCWRIWRYCDTTADEHLRGSHAKGLARLKRSKIWLPSLSIQKASGAEPRNRRRTACWCASPATRARASLPGTAKRTGNSPAPP
mmetsp:Transcript_127439/g.407896  ORF Transcript_127439/g.407896 Transcript_127439/m.407896 type:complete len:244 (+) Transcript_127439:831-1562(+)